MALHKGIKIHQHLDDWLVRARSHQTCLQHTLVALCQELGCIINIELSELDLKQVFNFYRLPVRPKGGPGQTHPRVLADLKCQDTGTTFQTNLSCHELVENKSTRSTPYEANTVALEKSYPYPTSLHLHLKQRLQDENFLQDQPLHPLSHALQMFTDACEFTEEGTLQLPVPFQKESCT